MRCTVLEVDAPRRLVYPWQGDAMAQPTIIIWTLQPVAIGTHLRLEHTGFVGAAGLAISELLGRGWRGIVENRLRGWLLQEPLQVIGLSGHPVELERAAYCWASISCTSSASSGNDSYHNQAGSSQNPGRTVE